MNERNCFPTIGPQPPPKPLLRELRFKVMRNINSKILLLNCFYCCCYYWMKSLRTREFGNQQFLLLFCQVKGVSALFSQKDPLPSGLLAQIEPRSQQDCLCLIAQSLLFFNPYYPCSQQAVYSPPPSKGDFDWEIRAISYQNSPS